MIPLRLYLLNAYGGFADRRYKDHNLDRPIKVDSRNSHDVYPYFPSMFVSVPDLIVDSLRLTLQHFPSSPEVEDLITTLGGTIHPADFGLTVILRLKASQGPALKRLATAVKAIVGRGRTYDDPNLIWICGRTAASLEELADHLIEYYAERESEEVLKSPDVILARRRRAFIRSKNPGTPRSGPQNGEHSRRTGGGE